MAADVEHVVSLVEAIDTPDAVWLAMKHMPGSELFRIIEESGEMSVGMARALVRQLLIALAGLDAVGVVSHAVEN